MASSKPFRGPWIIAACFVTFGIASGFPYYNISFFFDYFRNDHGWSQQAITLGAPIAVLLMLWAGPTLSHRWSPRWLIVIGTGLTFAAFQWFARMGGSKVEYYAAWCVYMLGYFLSGPIPHQIILSNWFAKKRGRAMGIAYVGGAVLGAMGNKLNPWLVTFLPYTDALKISSFIMLLAWPVAIFVLRDRPEDVGQVPDGVPRTAASAPEPSPMTLGDLSQKNSFWLLLVGSAASIGSIACVNFLMKFVLEEQGFVDGPVCGDRRPPCCGIFRRRVVQKKAHAGHLRARGRGYSNALSRYTRAPRLCLPLRHHVRLRDGGRLHAHSFDGG